jgi:hypothetical protein
MKLTKVAEYGKRFETGRRVCFRFLRNTEKAPYLGAKYQQDIEPAGLYVIHNPTPGDLSIGWAVGECCFDNPLVIPLNTDPTQPVYSSTSWKANLHRAFRATGNSLSRKLRARGYDGIVTVGLNPFRRDAGKPVDTREIVALAPNACKVERVKR